MENNVEKIDLDHVDWQSSREFFASLKDELEKLDDKDEAYNFTWVGKRKSIIEAGAPIEKILRPDVEASKDFDNTKNMLIVGDNLDALKLLQESYLGKIKMIYIDPPYNTGHDFVYRDNFTVKKDDYADNTIDEEGNKIISEDEFTENSKANGRFHSDWLSMMYPRLKLARNLLTDDGVIFISIDDNEQANLKKLCDEIFGEENFIAIFPWRKRTAKSDVPFGVSQDYEWILLYAKSDTAKLAMAGKGRKYYETEDFPRKPWRTHDLTTQRTASERPNSFFTIVNPKTGEEFPADPNRTWRITSDTYDKYASDNRIVFPGDYDFLKISKPVLRYWKDDDMAKDGESFGKVAVSTKLPDEIGMSQAGTKEMLDLFSNIPFAFPKNTLLLKFLEKISTSEDSIILDFFAGSGTTGHAVMDLNAEDGGKRKYILVQLDEPTAEKSEARKAGYETIDQITAERLRRAGDKVKQEHPDADLDTGFRVYRVDSTNEREELRKPLSEIQQSDFLDAIDNLKPDRTPLDLLFGVVYVLALPFDLKLETRKIGSNTVYLYDYSGENTGLVACFDDKIPAETVRAIAELKSLTAAFKDASFADSAEKINLSEHFRVISPDTKVKVV